MALSNSIPAPTTRFGTVQDGDVMINTEWYLYLQNITNQVMSSQNGSVSANAANLFSIFDAEIATASASPSLSTTQNSVVQSDQDISDLDWITTANPSTSKQTITQNITQLSQLLDDKDIAELDWMPLPVPSIPQSKAISSPPTYSQCDEVDAAELDWMPTCSPSPIAPTGLLAVAGGLTSVVVINNTTTPTTSGITLPAQTALAGSMWRVTAFGAFTAVSSATARNAVITPMWGSTALPTISVPLVASVAQTTAFECEFTLLGISTTSIRTVGYCLNKFNSDIAGANLLTNSTASAANTAVTAGSQTIDLQFSMSTSVATDNWRLHNVIIERLI